MKSVCYIIVEADILYDNVEAGIITNDSIESVSNINRVATVVSTPPYTVLEVGDEILIHHNILRKKYNTAGVQLNSNFWIEDNRFFVPLNEVFMVKRDSEWESLNPFCFIEPIASEQSAVGFNLSDNLHKGNVDHRGIVIYTNNDLIEAGINKGDEVIFKRDSQYEFLIDNTLCYKMTSRDILGKLTKTLLV
jgi:co-chaperonin GroES (HSP10)